jgi:pentatricopeptide repeat protein
LSNSQSGERKFPAGPFDKRDAALDAIARFKARLVAAQPDVDVAQLVGDVRTEFATWQGDERDRPYLARSVCQVSTLLRRYGRHAATRQLIEWVEARGVVDAYLLTELVQCHVIAGDLAQAELTCERARTARLLSEPMYTALISAYGRRSNAAQARAVFERALNLAFATAHSFCALITAYARCGDLEAAHGIFDLAHHHGCGDSAVHAMMVSAYGRADRPRPAYAIFAVARDRGVADVAVYAAILAVCVKAGQFSRARAIFNEARRAGLVDSRTYRVMAKMRLRRELSCH